MKRSRLESFGSHERQTNEATHVDEAEKLRKLIGNNSNPANPPQSAALGIIRRSVDDAVMATKAPDIPALQAARRAAAERFGMRDSSPASVAAADGEEPDRFFKRYVLNGDVADLRGLKAAAYYWSDRRKAYGWHG
jgi:hypothetical protein